MLITTKKIKRTRNKFTAKENQLEYSLPPQWAKASLADLGDFSGGKTPSKNNSEYWGGEIPWVTPKDMKTSRIKNSEDHVSQLALEDGLNINLPGSILFVVRSGILRRRLPIAINDVSCTVNQDLKVLRPFEEKTTQYLMLMCRGFEDIILKEFTKTGTTVESIIFEKFSTCKFPLPPLAEQQRIVTKVDELMALCDHLKASLHSAQDTQLKLADSIVEQAIQSPPESPAPPHRSDRSDRSRRSTPLAR